MPQQKLAELVKQYTAWLPVIAHTALDVVVAVLSAGIVYILLRIALRLWDWRQLRRQTYVFIEITPPLSAAKTPLQSTEWVNRLYGIGLSRDKQERLRRMAFSVSLELSSALRDGIRYYVRVPEQEANMTKLAISSYLQKARIRIVNDYLPAHLNYKTAQVLDFRLSNAHFLPLKTEESFLAHDPFTQLTNAMTGLNDTEHVVLQIVMQPAVNTNNDHTLRSVKRNDDLLALAKQHHISPVITLTFGLAFKAVRGVVMFITDVVYSPPAGSSAMTMYEQQARMGIKPARSITPFEQALNDTITDKATQKQFRVAVRAIVVGEDKKQTRRRIKALKAALSAYDSEYQQLQASTTFPAFVLNRYRLYKFAHRLPPLFQRHANKLAPSEIANIYHFPAPGSAGESLVQSLSHTLPATLSQKRGTDIDVIVGRNIHQDQRTDIGLSRAGRMKHMYVIGSTGTGKTTMLTSMIYQDMVNGKGLAVLDPHGDMFRELCEIVPKHRRKDVVILDPSDRAFPIGLNALNPGITFGSKEDSHGWIASSIIFIFSKLADERYWGPRMEHILRNATLTALQLPNPSFYTLQRLLTDKHFQRTSAKSIRDQVLKDFWNKEMLPLGDSQLATMVAPLANRLGQFLTDPMSRNILLQQQSSLRLSEIMDEGKILLVNLSKGDIGEDRSTFFGTVLTSLIWMAAFQRTKLREKDRKDFYLYIDEFQNFAAPSFTDITSEGRKFHIGLIASHQNVAQITDENLLKVMVGNAHSIVCFRSGPNDEAFILPFMKPAVEKGSIVNLPPYTFFMRTLTDESELAFSGTTVPLEHAESLQTAKDVIAASRKQYATPRKEVEAYLNSLFSGKASKEEPVTGKDKPGKVEP